MIGFLHDLLNLLFEKGSKKNNKVKSSYLPPDTNLP